MSFYPQFGFNNNTAFNGFGGNPGNWFGGFNQPWNQSFGTGGHNGGNWNNNFFGNTPWNSTPWNGTTNWNQTNWNQTTPWNVNTGFNGFNPFAAPFGGNWNNSSLANTPWNTNFNGFGNTNTFQGQPWNNTAAFSGWNGTPFFGSANWSNASPFNTPFAWNQNTPFAATPFTGVPFGGIPFGWWNQSPVNSTETIGTVEQGTTNAQNVGAYPYPFAAFNPFFCFNPPTSATCNGATQAA